MSAAPLSLEFGTTAALFVKSRDIVNDKDNLFRKSN
jgi:hypothetical protein